MIQCACIECIGYQPEPYAYQDPNTLLWAIWYLNTPLSTNQPIEKEAWEAFDKEFS